MLAGAAAVSLVAAAWSAWRESTVAQAEAVVARQSVLMARHDDRWRLLPMASPPPDAPPRLLMAHALWAARAAAAMPDGRRGGLVAIARRDLAAVRPARPHWGDAWLLTAFVASLDDAAPAEDERLAIAHSYADAPLLAAGGTWRAIRVMGRWRSYPRWVQAAAVTETVWLLDGAPEEERQQLFAAARMSPAYAAVFGRWAGRRD